MVFGRRGRKTMISIIGLSDLLLFLGKLSFDSLFEMENFVFIKISKRIILTEMLVDSHK